MAAALLFTGCGEDSKKVASVVTSKAVENTKEVTNTAVDATKEVADKAVEAAKNVASEAKNVANKALEATKEAVKSTKEVASKAVDAAVASTENDAVDVAGKAAFAKCAGCHGVDGKTKALGKSEVIAGQTKEELVSKINGYKAGTRNIAGMGNLMRGQVASMDDTTIDAIATYISTLK